MANERLFFFLHATFTVHIFWLNIAVIAVHSGEHCGLWASGSETIVVYDMQLAK